MAQKKRKSKKTNHSKRIESLRKWLEKECLRPRFEQNCKRNLKHLQEWMANDKKRDRLYKLADKGFQEASKRKRGRRWPILSGEKKPDIEKDLPQTVCILFAFYDHCRRYRNHMRWCRFFEFKSDDLLIPELWIEYEDEIVELLDDVDYSFFPEGQRVDIFTRCMVEVKKYIGTDITKTVRKKTQSALYKRKTGVDFSSDDDIKKRFTFNDAQAFFDGKDLGLPAGDTVSILKKLVDSVGEVVGHKHLDQNSNPSNASDILKGRIRTIKIALKRKRIPYRIESKRGIGYVLQHK